ncbi:hypothetical protein KUV42_06380 [Ferrimonas balearica]|nr:hypothetical protein [Ferrimonas balearica]MBY6224127.1 hypothetical protein [Ferrimonas balearica]
MPTALAFTTLAFFTFGFAAAFTFAALAFFTFGFAAAFAFAALAFFAFGFAAALTFAALAFFAFGFTFTTFAFTALAFGAFIASDLVTHRQVINTKRAGLSFPGYHSTANNQGAQSGGNSGFLYSLHRQFLSVS